MQVGKQTSLAAMTLGAIGVVYGDIGTSVLYAMKEVFEAGHLELNEANVMGILSVFVWTLNFVVSFKYLGLVLRADNDGEGGLIAMLALAVNAVGDSKPRLRNILLVLGVFGTCLFYGDGVITPSISVLSAVEGMEVLSPALHAYIVPLALGILFGLFYIQRHGTAGIGKFFGPITLCWFITIAVLGVVHIVKNPNILWAISPIYALHFILAHPMISFVLLSAVVLCVTGAEALYADMGHFGKKPIRLAWFLVIMPALVLNYFGQGAFLLGHPEALSNPFFRMVPSWGLVPLLILAGLATVIASQALITGAFSITKQVVQLGYLPRMRVIHTSAKEAGQIYIPFVNWILFTAIALAVVTFGSSSAFASAYGIAVTTDMLITTILAFFVIRYAWKLPLVFCIASTTLFFAVDMVFWASNLRKFFTGGWFPIAIGLFLFLLMMTWKKGRSKLHQQKQDAAVALPAFLDSLFVHPPVRVSGMAVYLTPDAASVPSALLHNLKHNKVLHNKNLFVTVHNSHEKPWIGLDKRVHIEALGHDCWSVQLYFGFKNDPNIPEALATIKGHGFDFNAMETSYFLSRDTVVPVTNGTLRRLQNVLFSHMHREASSVTEFFMLPSNATVELGAKVHMD